MREETGDRLRRIRKELGITQAQAESRFGLGKNSWQTLELKNRLPKVDVLAELVSLGFDGNWLLTGRGQVRGPVLVDPASLHLDNAVDDIRALRQQPQGVLDEGLLTRCIRALQGHLAAKGKVLPPAKFAAAINELYVHAQAPSPGEERVVDADQVERLVYLMTL